VVIPLLCKLKNHPFRDEDGHTSELQFYTRSIILGVGSY
jgi:hypothetical protein